VSPYISSQVSTPLEQKRHDGYDGTEAHNGRGPRLGNVPGIVGDDPSPTTPATAKLQNTRSRLSVLESLGYSRASIYLRNQIRRSTLITCYGQRKSGVPSLVGFADFVLAHREQILQSWIATVDQHPNISTSDNLTYTQLLDHLPELCTELAALLKEPDAQQIKREARQDARAHGWKRWRQGYKLEELIREICLIRRDLIDTRLKASAAVDERFDLGAQNSARRVVECFFDNVIIEATVQFVEEHQEAVRQLHATLKPTAAGNAEFIQRITHLLREPLGPLLLGLEVLLREEALSPRGVEMIGVLQRGVKKEAEAIEELLRSTELLEKNSQKR
jgi:signal transduction histidine kinase